MPDWPAAPFFNRGPTSSGTPRRVPVIFRSEVLDGHRHQRVVQEMPPVDILGADVPGPGAAAEGIGERKAGGPAAAVGQAVCPMLQTTRPTLRAARPSPGARRSRCGSRPSAPSPRSSIPPGRVQHLVEVRPLPHGQHGRQLLTRKPVLAADLLAHDHDELGVLRHLPALPGRQ